MDPHPILAGSGHEGESGVLCGVGIGMRGQLRTGVLGWTAVWVSLFCGPLVGLGSPSMLLADDREPLALVGETAPGEVAEPVVFPSDLAREIIAGLADGSDVEQKLAQLEAILDSGLRTPYHPVPPVSMVARDAARALERLRENVIELRDPQTLIPGTEIVPGTRIGLTKSQGQRVLGAFESMRASDLLFRERLADIRHALTESEIGGEILARLDAAELRYLEALNPWIESLEGPLDNSFSKSGARPNEVGEGLDRLDPRVFDPAVEPVLRILGANGLPYRQQRLAPREPATQPLITPSYLDPTDPGSIPGDLRASIEGPMSAEIVAQAQALAFDPLQIYEFVRNEIATEWYAGIMKGAEGTLRHRAGNDADQAALLVALLRAASQPARYIHGVVEFSVESLAESLGLDDPTSVPEALAQAGVAHRPVVRGGRIAAVEVESTWVTAFLPYSNYRGAVVDLSGRTWVPLAPSIKGVDSVPATGVLRQMEYDVDSALETFLSEILPDTPLSEIRRRVVTWLATEQPDATYADQLGSDTVRAANLGVVPNSLPVRVVAVLSESTSAPAHLLNQVTVRFLSGLEDNDPAILEHQTPLFRVIDRRITLNYLPETVDDHRTIDLFGGMGAVPPYLVRLRPQITVAGHPVAVGEGGVPMAASHRLEVVLSGPWGTENVTQTMLAGGYASLALGAQTFHPLPDPENNPLDIEPPAARILSQTALAYGAAWDAGEEELGRLLDTPFVRPLPSVILIANEVEIGQIEDLPVSLDWTGVSLDAALRVAEPLPNTTDPPAPRDWLRLAAIQGSSLESRIFETRFLVNSISADRGLALARQAGIPVLRIDSASAATLLPLPDHPPAVNDDLARWVSLGNIVEIPQTPVTFRAWTGSTWRVEDPITGAGGYFIAGGLAGGQTADDPGDWVFEGLVQELRAPYGVAANLDPMAAVRVVKMMSSDAQVGSVGRELNRPLTVFVTDVIGRPVQGAEVVFTSWRAGRFVGPGDLVTPTDSEGLARARFWLGLYTSYNPIYLLRHEGDIHPTRGSLHEILVSVDSDVGTLTTEPFSALAYPRKVEKLERLDGLGPLIEGRLGSWVDTIAVSATDGFNNPVSNVRVDFSVGGRSRSSSCTEYDVDPEAMGLGLFFARNPALSGCPTAFPLRTECGVSGVSDLTSPFGARAGVLLGEDATQRYSVMIQAPEEESITENLVMHYQGDLPSDDCIPIYIEVQGGPYFVDQFGNNVTAAEAGGVLSVPFEAKVLISFEGIIFGSIPEGGTRGALYYQALSNGLSLRRVKPGRHVGYLESPTSDAWEGDPVPMTLGPDLIYRSPGQTSFLPRLNDYWAAGYSVTSVVDPETGEILPIGRFYENCYFPEDGYCIVRPVTQVWGVDPVITQFTPRVVQLDPLERLKEPLRVDFSPSPFEYKAFSSEIVLLDDQVVTESSPAADKSGPSYAKFRNGLQGTHVRAVLNRGSEIEVRSGRVEIPTRGRLFDGVTKNLSIQQDVDLVNNRVCIQPDIFGFELLEPAEVTLKFKRIEGETPEGEPVFGDELDYLGNFMNPGYHTVEFLPGELPAGTYRFTLRGETIDGLDEEAEGFATSGFRSRDVLPVGHVLVEGVDLFDGHLTVSREDVNIPGRGSALQFGRTYSSLSPSPGPMGQGWSHAYDSRIIRTQCGELDRCRGRGFGDAVRRRR